MIDFVLCADGFHIRQQQCQRCPCRSAGQNLHAQRASDFPFQPWNRQTALLDDCRHGRASDFGIYQRKPSLLPVGYIHDDDAQGLPYLRRSEPNSPRNLKCVEHVGDEFDQLGVERGDGLRDHPQTGRRLSQDFKYGHESGSSIGRPFSKRVEGEQRDAEKREFHAVYREVTREGVTQSAEVRCDRCQKVYPVAQRPA